MKFIYSIAIIALISFVGDMFLPWWCIAPIAFVTSIFVVQSPVKSFLSGFLAIFILWIIQSYFISTANHHILAHKLSLLIVKMDRPIVLFVVTGFIGGLVAGLASLTGSYLKNTTTKSSNP